MVKLCRECARLDSISILSVGLALAVVMIALVSEPLTPSYTDVTKCVILDPLSYTGGQQDRQREVLVRTSAASDRTNTTTKAYAELHGLSAKELYEWRRKFKTRDRGLADQSNAVNQPAGQPAAGKPLPASALPVTRSYLSNSHRSEPGG